MVDRSIAKGKDTLLQRLSSPLSVLAEFDVPHCSRFERYGRPVTNRRRGVNSTSAVNAMDEMPGDPVAAS
jgi:hypothetical protein